MYIMYHEKCITTPPEEDPATAIGNKHKTLVKIGRVVPETFSLTEKQTNEHSHHILHSPIRGKVTTTSN